MTTIFLLVFFGLGLIIGSFLNVVIYRYNTQKTLGGRSACMSCRSTLHWYELVPVFSYLGLGGKCGTCQSKISIQYPLVELLTGIIFALLFYKFQNIIFNNTVVFALSFAYYASMFSLLLVIAIYDIKHKIIPDVLAFIFGLGAFLGVFFFYGNLFFPHIPALKDFLGGFVISVPFALIWLLSRGTWMGLGDAKLAVGMGFLLGMMGMLSATVIAFWVGAVIGIILLIFSNKYGRRTEIPFAPFLVLGTFIAFLFSISLFIF